MNYDDKNNQNDDINDFYSEFNNLNQDNSDKTIIETPLANEENNEIKNEEINNFKNEVKEEPQIISNNSMNKKQKIFKILFIVLIVFVISIVSVLVLAELKLIKLPWLDYPEILNLSQNEVMLKKDSKFQFSTYVYPSQVKYGRVIFESSDPTVADVNSITGYVEAKKNGVATIKAYLEDYGDIYDTCDVVVSNNNVMVQSIEVTNPNVDMLVGGTYKLKYTYTPKNAGLHYFSYSSSDNSIVTVNNKGEVTAVAPGKAAINILEEVSGNIIHQEFTVYGNNTSNKGEEYVVSSIKLSSNDVKLNIGGKYQVTATVYPEDVVQSISWSSQNNSVATVSDDGLITAIDYGDTQILATAIDGTNKIIYVSVMEEEIPIKSIKLNDNISIKQGERKKIGITIEPKNATNQEIEWSSSNEEILKVDQNGTVEGLTVGSAVVTAKTTNGLTSNTLIKVTKQEKTVAVTDLVLSSSSTTISVGSSVNINTKIVPSNATNKKITWSTSDSSIATISNGMVYGKSAGAVIITATTNNRISRQIQIVVNPVTIKSISLNETNYKLGIDGEIKLYVTFNPSNATNKKITWTSSNSSVATVNSNGVVTAKKLGDTIITAQTSNGKVATCKIKVTNESIPVTSLSLSAKKYVVKVNEKVGITPIISPNNATNQKVSYKVNNSAIAEVQSDGTIKGIKEGIVEVTATSNNGKTSKSYVIVKNKNASVNYLDGSTIKYWYDNTYGSYAITHIWVKNAYEQFKVEMPDKFGTLANPSKLTQKAAKKNSGKTLVSVNASGFVTENFSPALYKANKAWKNTSVSPIVIYEGKVIRDFTNADIPTLARIYGMTKSGKLTYYVYSKEKEKNTGLAQKILNDGVKYTIGWSPVLVSNGTVSSSLNKQNNIRQGICQIDNNNFLFITNISSNRSKGFSHYSLAQKMVELGCKTGFNLDGGGSTSLYYVKKGSSSAIKLRVTEGSYGRSIPDIIYFVGD